jgi:hypothetical protein
MDRKPEFRAMGRVFLFAGVIAAGVLAGASCNPTTTTGTADDNTLINEALSFDGNVSGKIVTTQSTRSSTTSASAAQTIPDDIDADTTRIRFHDLDGNDLESPSGLVLPDVPLNPDGTFDANDLPVGTDFTVCVDTDNDGTCEMESCVNIPADRETGQSGALDGVQVDPLTTMVLAKLRTLMKEANLRPGDLPFSPATLVGRVVDAYEHLFVDSGIDQEIRLSDIEGVIGDELAALFEDLVPGGAKSGMDLVRGNIGLAAADDIQSAALAAAEVFLQAGFPIVDEDGGIDLSSLRDIPGIEEGTEKDLFGGGEPFDDEFIDDEFSDGGDAFPDSRDEFVDGPDDILLETASVDEDFQRTFYYNPFAEPDRNFSEERRGDGFVPSLPIINDYVLRQMAELHLAGKKITLGDLHTLLTSLENGMGARITYFVQDPNFFGPPLTVFETADGEGKAVNMEVLFARLFERGFEDVEFDEFDSFEADFRSLLTELLSGTIPPTLDTLAGGFMTDRVGSIEDFATRIRNAAAHIPFSRSGPSDFYVVADGSLFDSGTPSAITVDVDIDPDGLVRSVTYNPTGDGAYYLSFTEYTAEEGLVGLLVREIGQEVYTPGGRVILDMNDSALFGDINGVAFVDFVSEIGDFLPGVSVVVTSDKFVPEARDFGIDDREADSPDTDLPNEDFIESDLVDIDAIDVQPVEPEISVAEAPDDGPNDQIYVLATSVSFDAEPVRVDYDFARGIATFNPGGRHLLAFLPDTNETGLFALFNEETGRFAGADDPITFFDAPTDIPDGFDEFFNLVDDFDTLGDIDAELLNELSTLGYLDDLGNLGDIGYLEDLGYLDAIEPVDASTPTDSAPAPTPAELDPALTDQVFVDGFILISVDMIEGVFIESTSKFIFGTDVPNLAYDASGDPFFDDLNGNGIEDAGEPTAPYRPVMFDSRDWRSVDLRLFYRRSDNDGAVTFEDVDFASDTPMTIDGVPLVARAYVARLNAFRFGRPNTAINLLTAFLPPNFFDGTHAFDADTELNVFAAVAVLNLMIDQLFNVEADIDVDGLGPIARQSVTIDAELFIAPIDDPFVLILKGFTDLSFEAVDERR